MGGRDGERDGGKDKKETDVPGLCLDRLRLCCSRLLDLMLRGWCSILHSYRQHRHALISYLLALIHHSLRYHTQYTRVKIKRRGKKQ